MFYYRIIGRRVQNIVVAQINSYVPYPIGSAVILSGTVGKKHQIATTQILRRHIIALRNLSPRGHIKIYARAYVIYVLSERRAIVFSLNELVV